MSEFIFEGEAKSARIESLDPRMYEQKCSGIWEATCHKRSFLVYNSLLKLFK